MSPTIYPDEPDSRLPEPPDNAAPLFAEEDENWESPFEGREKTGEPVAYRGATSDPVFGYLIAIALSVGLIPLIPANADLRYAVAWMVMAGFGVLAWLLGSSARIWMETPENLGWGVVFGLIVGVPFVIVGGQALQETARRLFPNMSAGETLAFLVFVIPLAETLFFRGVLQEKRGILTVGLLSSLWSALIYFPMLEVNRYPAVALIIGSAIVLLNILYSYVRERNGLAAAWLCQIVAHLTLLFIPSL
jgi:hypothetical protein